MENKKMKMMKFVEGLPQGVRSESGKYFCETCKKLFLLNEPVCPYMTKMCLNAPIPVEVVAPSNPEAFERFGLFYPKIPQRVMDSLMKGIDAVSIGKKFAELYLNELREWHIQYKTDLIYLIKTFIVFVSGSEVAQRVLEKQILFMVMDMGKVFKNEEIKEVIRSGAEFLRKAVNLERGVTVDFIDVVPGDYGRYYCKKCSMFFEFGMKREKVTCPLMAQKCMFEPKNVSNETGTLSDLVKIYRITPHLYGKFFRLLPKSGALDSLKNAVSLFVKDIDDQNLILLAKELGMDEG